MIVICVHQQILMLFLHLKITEDRKLTKSKRRSVLVRELYKRNTKLLKKSTTTEKEKTEKIGCPEKKGKRNFLHVNDLKYRRDNLNVI